jgi:hypothetical protein
MLLFSFWVENLIVLVVFVPMTLTNLIFFFFNPTSILILIKALLSSLPTTISQAIVAMFKDYNWNTFASFMFLPDDFNAPPTPMPHDQMDATSSRLSPTP